MSKASKLVPCKTCGLEIAANAKACPHCGAKKKKPVYRRGWFVLLVIVALAVAAVPVFKMAIDYDVTVKVNGDVSTVKASTIHEMVVNDMQEYLDTFVNSNAEISFTAKVQDVSTTYDPSGEYEGMRSCDFAYYIEAVSLFDGCEKGDTVRVTGRFVDTKKVGGNVDYIRLYATSVEVIK